MTSSLVIRSALYHTIAPSLLSEGMLASAIKSPLLLFMQGTSPNTKCRHGLQSQQSYKWQLKLHRTRVVLSKTSHSGVPLAAVFGEPTKGHIFAQAAFQEQFLADLVFLSQHFVGSCLYMLGYGPTEAHRHRLRHS